MNSSIWLMLVVLAIAKVQSIQLDPGPQTLTENTPASQKPQKRDVIIYLTPDQIKAIQGGKGYINSQQIEQAETSEENQEEREQAQQEQEELFQLRSLEENSEALEEEDNELPSSIPVEEPNTEEVEQDPQFPWVYRPPQDRNFVPTSEDNYPFLRFYPDPEEQTEEAQPETEETEEETEDDQGEEQPEAQSEAQPEASPQQIFRLVPYEAATEKSISTTTRSPQEDSLKERWLRLLEINRSQLRKASSAQEKTTSTQQLAEPETTLSKLRLLARNNNQNQAAKNQDKRRKNLLQKQKALIQAEARARNAPNQSRKETTIRKQNQAPLIKHVKVPTPVLVPIPEPFEVKVPHPFPVPFEIFKQNSAQKTKPRKAEAKKPATSARSESEKRVTSPQRPSDPTESSVEGRRGPADDKKDISVETPSRKQERLTIIRHVWEK